MKGENKKEEIQSRREFFKEAAKKALPILGVMALINNPVIAKTVENEPMGCNYGCLNSCLYGCQNSCNSGCLGTCIGGCSSCINTCVGMCGGCDVSCLGNCTSSLSN